MERYDMRQPIDRWRIGPGPTVYDREVQTPPSTLTTLIHPEKQYNFIFIF